MSGIIGGGHSSITQTGQTFDVTGDEASVMGQNAGSLSEETEGQINDVMQMLRAHFEETAAGMRQQATTAKNRLVETNWQGMSKENAVQIEEDLHGRIDQTLNQALEGVDQFGTMLRTDAQTFKQAVTGELMTIMRQIDGEYHQMGESARTFQRNLEQADQTIKG